MLAFPVIGAVVGVLGLIASLLAVAYRVGGLATKLDNQGAMLAEHRKESAEANAALRDDVSELRKDAREVRERVLAIEVAGKLRSVK